MRWFHSYIWGRFAQPVGLLYVRNHQVAGQVRSALTQAVLTFIVRTLPRVPSPFTARDLWAIGLGLSYRAELRAERPHKLIRLFEAAPNYYEHITRQALTALSFPVDIQKSDSTYRLYRSYLRPGPPGQSAGLDRKVLAGQNAFGIASSQRDVNFSGWG